MGLSTFRSGGRYLFVHEILWEGESWKWNCPSLIILGFWVLWWNSFFPKRNDWPPALSSLIRIFGTKLATWSEPWTENFHYRSIEAWNWEAPLFEPWFIGHFKIGTTPSKIKCSGQAWIQDFRQKDRSADCTNSIFPPNSWALLERPVTYWDSVEGNPFIGIKPLIATFVFGISYLKWF